MKLREDLRKYASIDRAWILLGFANNLPMLEYPLSSQEIVWKESKYTVPLISPVIDGYLYSKAAKLLV